MSLVGKIADLLTEQLLASVVPDIVELGTREFRRLNGIFREGKFHLNDRVSVSAPNTVVFSPALVTSIFDPDAFKEALEKLFEG